MNDGMKRKMIFSAFIAIAVITAGCSKTETTKIPEIGAITFGKTFVGAPVKAVTETTTDVLQQSGAGFYVYGGSSDKTDLFAGTHVTYDVNKWTYEDVKYWMPSKTYKFAAYAPDLTGASGEITFSYENGDGALTISDFVANKDQQHDLVYAVATPKTTGPTIDADPGIVDFSFKHILSKVLLKFEKGTGFADNVKLVISNLKVYGMNSKATYNGTTWTSQAGPVEEGNAFTWSSVTESGNIPTSEALYLIPQNSATVNISFDVALDDGQGTTASESKTGTITATWESDNVYTYTAIINSTDLTNTYPINFNGTVNGWTEQDNTGNVTVQ